MDKFFKLSEHGTTVRTEVLAGLTTFFAMSYILFVNPQMLSQTGMPAQGVFLATIYWVSRWDSYDGFLREPALCPSTWNGLNDLLYLYSGIWDGLFLGKKLGNGLYLRIDFLGYHIN